MRSGLRRMVLALACMTLMPFGWAQQPRVLKATTPGPNDTGAQYLNDLKAGIERRAAGRLRMDVYSNEVLGQIPTTVEGLTMGTIEFINTAVGFYVGIDPRFSVFDANGVFDDTAHALRTLNDAALREHFKSFGADRDVEVLMFYSAGPLLLLSRLPVTKLEDIRGLKVRIPGGPIPRGPIRLAGANPITMPVGEAMQAFHNRTVDATILTESRFVNFRYYDIAKDLTEIPGTHLICAVLVRTSVLKALGPELEAIVREEAAKAAAVVPARNVEEIIRMRKLWLEKGGRIHLLSATDQQRYSEHVRATVDRISEESREWRDSYDVLRAAAQRQRR